MCLVAGETVGIEGGKKGGRPVAKELRVGMVGYQFMGKAHSNGYRQAPRFIKLSAVPVMQALCGRNEAAVKAAAKEFGWAGYETDW